MTGYVRIHRSLLGHPAFRNESETMAFAWLIAKAAWKATRVRYKGHTISLRRGQVAISQRDMAGAFDRDKAWIERLWKRLKSEAMIEVSSEAGVAVLTICNYDEYQAEGEDAEAPREARREAGNEADARQRRGTEQRKEEDKKYTSPDGEGGAPPNLAERLWNDGLAVVIASGVPEKQGRSLLGKWRKAAGERFGRTEADAKVLALLAQAQTQAVSDLVPWMEAAIRNGQVVPLRRETEEERIARERAEWVERNYGPNSLRAKQQAAKAGGSVE